MDIVELKNIARENGIVGAGGAGFPTYMKIDGRAKTIILNCAECEPLLKLHQQLLEQKAEEILKTFSMLADIIGAKEAIIGIKEEYKATVKELKKSMELYPNVRLHLLKSEYPMGDEVVLIYEATGKVVRPGGLPIEAGIAVFNVETIYNLHLTLVKQKAVTDKLVTIVGEVTHPVTVRVPLGCTVEEVVELAGEVTVKEPVYFIGGPMMGFIGTADQLITKTTNAIIVLPKDHYLVQRKNRKTSVDMKRTASVCCQCEVCTDLCPRNALGHPIAPHKFMRSAANQDFQNTNVFLDTMFCCSCGVCELYACPQGLSPRSLITEYKDGLRKAGVKPSADAVWKPVNEAREYRKVPEKRLEARLGLSKYEKEAPLSDQTVVMKQVKVLLSQHIGAPAIAVVTVGQKIQAGEMIAKPAEGLSVAIHASINGTVKDVNATYITIRNEE